MFCVMAGGLFGFFRRAVLFFGGRCVLGGK